MFKAYPDHKYDDKYLENADEQSEEPVIASSLINIGSCLNRLILIRKSQC